MSEAYGSDPRFERFIQALREGKTVDDSRKESSLNWNTLYKMKKRDPSFLEAWERALMDGGRKFPVTADPRFDVFLENLRVGKTVARAMTDAGLYWRRLDQRKHSDPEFLKAWDAALVASGRQLGDTDDPRFEGFLEALKESKSLPAALARSDLDCRSLYDYRQRNRSFRARCDKIMGEGVESAYGDPRFEIFLTALREGKTINSSMKESALNWKTLYSLRNGNEAFRGAWAEAAALGGRICPKFRAITNEVLEAFLVNVREGDTVKDAAAKAGVTLASVYKRSARDPELDAAWDEASRVGKAKNLRQREERGVFLSQLEQGLTVSEAARVAGKDVTTFYRLRRKDPEFAERWGEIQARQKAGPRRRRGRQRGVLPAAPQDADLPGGYDPGALGGAGLRLGIESEAASLGGRKAGQAAAPADPGPAKASPGSPPGPDGEPAADGASPPPPRGPRGPGG
jgi:hypothetical protein